ncbi:hypothetical protein Ahy_B06g084858 [Arachis hypogaea]|uniref:Uncharacterized protein n=1 Tax=Arachis hypogaea TaxID=3818 RepID=A0A444YSX3_ARAHY|nr:hypothetical protein Ahy_B06g084858 [Arachis hypogaea]
MHFRWDAEHNLTIRNIFNHRMGRQLQQMLDDVRQGQDHRTTWLRPDIKNDLFVHWETDKGFRHWRLTNRANRVSIRSSKYTGGLATFMKTKARLIFEVVGLLSDVGREVQVHPHTEGEQRDIC